MPFSSKSAVVVLSALVALPALAPVGAEGRAPVDYVVLFEEDTPLSLIEAIRPDVLTKGADYAREAVVGGDLVESYGGAVARIELVAGTSTTGIIERITEGRED